MNCHRRKHSLLWAGIAGAACWAFSQTLHASGRHLELARDFAGPGANTGTYVNDARRGVSGAIAADSDTAVHFDGVHRQFVRVPLAATDIARFGGELERFSVELWYRSSTGNVGKVLLGSINDGDKTFVQLERDRRGFNLAFRSESGRMMRVYMGPQAATAMRDDRFHHALWTVTSASKGAAHVYLDGKEDTGAFVSGAAPGGFAPLQYDLAIGATNDRGAITQWLDATLDEVALFPAALDASRVAAHHRAAVNGVAGAYQREVLSDRPFAYWRLGEASRAGLRLLLDSRVVESVENAVLRVGRVRKHPDNPLFGQDHPWEVRFDNGYPSVIYDPLDRLYKVWYNLFAVDAATTGTPRSERVPGTYMQKAGVRRDGLGYAVSRDGIEWAKPMLDVCPWGGKPSNLLSLHVHGAGILRDVRDRDPARRYKMFFKGQRMSVRFSADGVRWGPYIGCPEIAAAGDAHNNALWVPELRKYVGFTRLWNDHRRVVGRTESADFIYWTKAEEVLRGERLLDTYSMPVFRYGGVYLGFPAIFDEKADRVWTELAWSPDTVNWHRIDEGTPLIPCAETKGACDWGTAFASRPIMLDDEIRLYYMGCNGGHFDWRDGFLCLATLRPDGFAGYEPADTARPAVVTTVSVRLGSELRITADADGGSIVVMVLDDAGKALATSEPVSGDVRDAPVKWPAGVQGKALAGRRGRLRFEIRRATLYSFLP